MEDLFSPLSDDEIDLLDDFLLERIDDDVDTDGKDEGVLGISELDGLLTALVSGPVSVPPSKWIPVVWGDYEPDWEDPQDFEQMMKLILRHMNGIASTLIEAPEHFEPIFLEPKFGDEGVTIVDEWCEGYMRGVVLTMEEWDEAGEEMTSMLLPILTFASEKGWEVLDAMTDDERSEARDAITPCVRKIHAWWLERRDSDEISGRAVNTPFVHDEPIVGRNDPCPCGSGKKFKKCCLH